MNKFISLTKIQVIDFFSRYTQHLNVKNKYLGLLTLALPALLILPAVQLVLKLHEIFNMVGFPELTITYMYIANVMIMLFTGIPFIISVFFYSKDLRLIATLPVKEDTIVFSKLASVYLYLLAISAFFLGTSVVIYSTIDGLKLISLIIGLLALLISPLLPMIFSTLVILPFMSFIGGKRRNAIVVLGNLLLIAAIIGMQLMSARMMMEPEAVGEILLQEDGLLRLIGQRFPPSIWLTKMIQGSLMNGGFFILLNATLIIALKVSAKVLYNRALMKFNQEGSQTIEKGKLYYEKKNKRAQIIKRHILIILNNPTFFLNTVFTMFIPILMFLIYSFTGQLSGDMLNSPMLEPYIMYIYAAVIATPGFIGSLSATAITREGKSFWETKVFPITAKDNIKYRIHTTLVISFFASTILAITAGYYLPVDAMMVVLSVIFCIASTLFFSTIDIVINIERPLLNWSSPTAAVKNNLNILLSLIVRLVIGVVGYFLYKIAASFDAYIVVLILSGFLFVLYMISIYLVYSKKYIEKFINII